MKQVMLKTYRCHCTKLSHHGDLVPVICALLYGGETASKPFCLEVLRCVAHLALT